MSNSENTGIKWKNIFLMMKNFRVLYQLNKILIKRISKTSYLYFVLLGTSLLIISLFTIVPLFFTVVQFSDLNERKEFYCFVYIILFLLDLIIFSVQISTRAMVEYLNLFIFPINYYGYIINKIAIFSTSIRCLLYFSMIVIFGLYTIIKSYSFIVTILVVIFNVLIYIVATLLLFMIFYFLKHIVRINQKNIISLTVVLVILVSNIVSLGWKNLLLNIPIFSNITNFYTYLFLLNISSAIGEIVNLLGWFIISLLVFYFFFNNYNNDKALHEDAAD